MNDGTASTSSTIYNKKERTNTLETTLSSSSSSSCDDHQLHQVQKDEFPGPPIVLGNIGNTSSLEDDSNGESKLQEQIQSHEKIKIHTHYIILSHGILGNPKEMGSIQEAIKVALKINHEDNQDHNHGNFERVVVHSSESNFNRTHDGIANGGRRLANEIEEFIKFDLSKYEKEIKGESNINISEDNTSDNNEIRHHHVSLSFVGNSLGGLYARYAISCLPTEMQGAKVAKQSRGRKSNFKITLHYNTFVTTATPHLGCASHTYFNLPRFIELIVGRLFSKTGKDLFQVQQSSKKKKQSGGSSGIDSGSGGDGIAVNKNSLIYEMGTNYERFLKPLSKFKKRVAYANAFQTDFQVPTATAGFLSKQSSSEHTILRNDPSLTPSLSPSFVVAVLQTQRTLRNPTPSTTATKAAKTTKNDERKVNDLRMSKNLDELGWDKIFIDTRDMNPMPSIPKKFNHGGGEKKMIEGSSDLRNFNFNSEVKHLKSKDVEKIMTSNDSIQIPLGHCMLIANMKSKGAEFFYSNGKPIAGLIATNLVKDVLQ